jgi:hypothetical protein
MYISKVSLSQAIDQIYCMLWVKIIKYQNRSLNGHGVIKEWYSYYRYWGCANAHNTFTIWSASGFCMFMTQWDNFLLYSCGRWVVRDLRMKTMNKSAGADEFLIKFQIISTSRYNFGTVMSLRCHAIRSIIFNTCITSFLDISDLKIKKIKE